MRETSAAAVVSAKEVRDNLRDRRSLASALLYPLLGPVLMVVLLTVLERSMSDRVEGVLHLPVVGAANAPQLMTWLQQQDIEIVSAPEDAESSVRVGDLDVVLLVPPTYAAEFGRGQPATVQLILDNSRQSAGIAVERVTRALEGYRQRTAIQRLMARGVSPIVISPIAIERLDLATPQSQAAQFLNLLPFFLIFSVFIGGMYLAIDTTAGERERGSLEPLLIAPVTRRDLVLGKLGATLLFSVIAVAGTLAAFGVALNLLPLDEYFGVRFSLGPAVLGTLFLIALPMTLLASALQIVVATFTRSFKEAQNYLGLLPMVPGLPGILLGFLPVRPSCGPCSSPPSDSNCSSRR